jgi:hypothetical protein
VKLGIPKAYVSPGGLDIGVFDLERIGEIKHVAHDRETRMNAQAQKDEGKTDQKIFGRASILRF